MSKEETKIPTAEEFWKNKTEDKVIDWKTEELMIEFAKLHVQEALRQASEKAYLLDERDGDSGEGSIYIQKESILNAYPLELIK